MDPVRRPILFTSGSGSGVLNPLLNVAAELARRGVPDLWFATDDNSRKDVEALSAKSEVKFLSLGEFAEQLWPPSWDEETYNAVTQVSRVDALRAVTLKSFDPNVWIDKYRRLDAVVEELEPALIIMDSVEFYRCSLPILKKIPFILSSPFLPSNAMIATLPPEFPIPHSGLPYDMTPEQRQANEKFRADKAAIFSDPEMQRRGVEYMKMAAEFGITPSALSQENILNQTEMVLCYSLAELDYPLELPEKIKLLGTTIPPLETSSEPDEVVDWLDKRDSVVYMGFGTLTRLTEEQVGSLVEVARRLDGAHDVLWKLPTEQQQYLPPADTLPGNLRIENWVPSQHAVLDHPSVKVFFSHGGGNGFHEGLYFGKPQVIRPLWVDCFDQDVRGADHGVSLSLDRPQDLDPTDIVDKLTKVLGTDSFRERAEHFGRLLHEAGGLTGAADLILASPALAVE